MYTGFELEFAKRYQFDTYRCMYVVAIPAYGVGSTKDDHLVFSFSIFKGSDMRSIIHHRFYFRLQDDLRPPARFSIGVADYSI
jgi:hypothetical protein